MHQAIQGSLQERYKLSALGKKLFYLIAIGNTVTRKTPRSVP